MGIFPYLCVAVNGGRRGTWSRADSARIWVADPQAADGFRAAESSVVLAGLGWADLDRLLSSHDLAGDSRRLADQVARAMLNAAATD